MEDEDWETLPPTTPPPPRKKPSKLAMVVSAMVIGLNRGRAGAAEEIIDIAEPIPLRQSVMAEAPNPILFEDGIPVDVSESGREYVQVAGRRVALMETDDPRQYKARRADHVMTENGLRVLDWQYDLTQKPGHELCWKDPDSGVLRPMRELPEKAIVHSYEVEIWRDDVKSVCALYLRPIAKLLT